MTGMSTKASQPMQEFVDCNRRRFCGKGHNDGAWVAFTFNVAGATVLFEKHRIIAPHSLLEHSLRTDELTADLARVARLHDCDTSVEAVVAAFLIRLDKYAKVNDRDEIEVGEVIQQIPP
jgi:hypothetical protein